MLKTKPKRVGVLYGGTSSEKEVSLKTGKAFIKALEEKGYEVIPILIGEEMEADIDKHLIDVAVIGLHGKYGEDGTVQKILEKKKIPYTGSGVKASALGMDKIETKRVALKAGISTPDFKVFCATTDSFQKIEKQLSVPVVIKAQAEGSTRGTTVVKDKKLLRQAISCAAEFDDFILAEDYVDGKEVTAPIVKGEVLPLIEIIPKSGFFDYHAKYTKGATEYIIPARVSQKTSLQIERDALKIYEVLGCRGYARADFMVDAAQKPWFIEINTLPGMTETSLVPMAAQKKGLSFNDLVEIILMTAGLDHE